MTLNDMVLFFLLLAVWLFWANIKQLSIKSGISTFECLKRNKSYVFGLLLYIGFVCWNFYANYRKEKEMYRYVCETAVVSNFYTVEDNGRYGMTINIPDVNVKFRITPVNWGYRDIEKWSKDYYMIWKNADSDTLYFEKGSHKLYVLIVKPRKHWYYISDWYNY